MNLSAINVSSRMPDLSAGSRIDEVGINERVARFQSRSIKTASKVEALRLVLSMIDLTTLEGQDTAGKVGQLCQKAIHLHDAIPGLPHVAAVCVYPTMVGVARQALEGHDIKVASVATAFPSGMASLAVKLDDTKVAVEQGANEIDMVISRGAFLQGEYGYEGIYLGVPARLGMKGMEKVIEIKLTDKEKSALDRSADTVRTLIGKLDI